METIFDLPAHPLIVHFPVVAIPALALLGLVMSVRPRFRTNYALPILVLGVVTVVATFVAAKSGEELAESIGVTDDFIDPHRDLGNMLRFFVLGLVASIAAMVAVNKRSTATGRDPGAVAAAVVVVVFASLSIVWTIRTGHEGAKAVWGSGVVEDDDSSQAGNETAGATTQSPTTTPTTQPPTTQPPTTQPTTTQPTTTTASTSGEATTSSATPVDGEDVFQSNCARCHGSEGGGGRGPSLVGIEVELPDKATAIDQIINGGNGMPSFDARLDADQIEAVVDYIYSTFAAS
jgi:mono/diheme cytochrome c family protein